MTDIGTTVRERLQKHTEQDDNIRKILMKHMELDDDKKEKNAGYYAWGLHAVECGVQIANILLAAKHPESGRGLRALQDLTYGLNGNDFWNKNAPALMPIITVALNAQKDWVDLTIRHKELDEYAGYDKLLSGAQAVALEVFSMLLYMTGGPLLLGTVSVNLKIDLAPYFVK